MSGGLRADLANQRIILGCVAAITCGLAGISAGVAAPGEPQNAAVIVAGVALAHLCVVDGALIRRPIPPLAAWLLLFGAPLTPLIRLLVVHRRAERVFALLFALVCGAAYVSGAMAAWALRMAFRTPITGY